MKFLNIVQQLHRCVVHQQIRMPKHHVRLFTRHVVHESLEEQQKDDEPQQRPSVSSLGIFILVVLSDSGCPKMSILGVRTCRTVHTKASHQPDAAVNVQQLNACLATADAASHEAFAVGLEKWVLSGFKQAHRHSRRTLYVAIVKVQDTSGRQGPPSRLHSTQHRQCKLRIDTSPSFD